MTFPSDGFVNYSPEELLDMGLDLYGLGRFEEAMTCWEQVLAMDSTNEKALDYLKAARVDSESRKASKATARVAPKPVVKPESKTAKVISIRNPVSQTTPAAKPVSSSVKEASNVPETEPPQAPSATKPSFEVVYKKAMNAYVRRQLTKAKSLFKQCLELRPDDRRVIHNLERLDRTTH